MKKFITKLLIFIIPVIIIIAWWEHGLGKMQNSYMLKKEQMDAQAPHIEALVLGGSFTLMGVDPDYFSMRGYNAANVQQSIFYDTRIALNYLDKMSSLKVVLIAVSYNSLWWQPRDFRDYFYAKYWNIPSPNIKWYDLERYSKILQYGSEPSFRFALKGFKINLVSGYMENGYATRDAETKPVNDSLAKEVVLHYSLGFSRTNLRSNVADIKKLMNELARRKIRAVLYTPPMSKSLYTYLDKTKLNIMDSTLWALSAEYNTHWFDYQDDPRFNNSDFRNLSHLNENGAVKFSKIINEEILEK